MKVFLCLILLVQSFISGGSDQPPFCKSCECQITNTTTVRRIVSCRHDVERIIFIESNWKNEKNETFDYDIVSFQNGVLPNLTNIFPASSLVSLDLSYNDIISIGSNVFMNLKNMTTLILSHNDLEKIDPDVFKGFDKDGKPSPLNNLKELRLGNNKIRSLNPDVTDHITELEILDLSNNPLGPIDNSTLLAISKLSNLKELYLQYTNITSLPDHLLHTLKHLQVLDLSGNPITEMPRTLAQAKNLTKLFMNNTGFVNLTEKNGFPELPKLKELHLCRNEHLQHLGKHSLSGLIQLAVLKLTDNIDLASIDPMAIAKAMDNNGGAIWPPLKELYLGNNKLSYLESELVARWDALLALDINDNPWTCECENQWLIEDLMPIYIKLNPANAKIIKCAAPIEMKDIKFADLFVKKSHMRCLDTNDARPDLDAAMLVGVLAAIATLYMALV
ncbi:unnamed protein product [Acanthoscelides obtectus]|uniref:Disease resistance R13L4/SHOC-2-like LRR domain-containing protein n=1 Tax=Acanthoscelides obtectus TaxID=200917 RepID=A0A9P0NZT9_ACAOB|nr:unnamed protein product [Acanthoscelides obtectus]CAK1638050.1 Leucine-rich repeat-containing protein 70 [Acanthoscelides obtectus]